MELDFGSVLLRVNWVWTGWYVEYCMVTEHFCTASLEFEATFMLTLTLRAILEKS